MRRSTLLSASVVTLLALVASPALAGGCGGGGGGGGGHHGGGHHKWYPNPVVVHRPVVKHYDPIRVVHPPVVHPPVCVAPAPVLPAPAPVCPPAPVVDHCMHPAHCFVYVQPGESLATICEREYGRSDLWTKVAEYNGLASGAQLSVQRPIMLPSIYNSGKMVASQAPAPSLPTANLGGTAPTAPVAVTMPAAQPPMFTAASFTQSVGNSPAVAAPTPQANLGMRPAATNLPTFAVGTTIDLDGQAFGEAVGRVRLSVGMISVTATVIDWNNDAVRVELPELELSGSTNATIEVFDAAGNSVVRSELRLTPVKNAVALAK